MTSTVASAGQQAEQDAAEFESRFGLRPIAAPRLDRPGPDDSDDDDAWPTPTSLLSRESTNTSSFGGRQQRAPVSEGVSDRNIRFDVKVDENAIEMLRNGLQVYSAVDVRDQTNAALHPSVVSDIALFLGDNAGKDLQGVQLNPQPMERDSTTLRFEIPQRDLDRIEQDAFLFNVPDNLRGKFDRVEFVAAPAAGSHEFSAGQSSGRRGSAFGFGGENGADSFRTQPTNRFSGTNEATPWNTDTPQPGPGFQPGEREFTGPYISPAELQARQNVAPIRQATDFNRSPLNRSPLNTGGQFRTAGQEQEVEPKQSSFDRPWEQAQENQIPRGQTTLQRSRPVQQDRNDPVRQESIAAQELRLAKQQLALAKADHELLLRDANDWKREAQTLAQERNDLGKQLQAVNERVVTKQSVSTPPARYAVGQDYLGRPIDAAGNLIKSFGSQREDFPRRETAFAGWPQIGQTQAELNQQQVIDDLEAEVEYRRKENVALQIGKRDVEAELQGLLERRRTYDTGYQPTSYTGQNQEGMPRLADADLVYGKGNAKLAQDLARQQNDGGRGNRGGHDNRGNRGDEERANGAGGEGQELSVNKKSSSDLIWLLPLLLLSLGLNFFLWIHSRSLYLRYDELAEDLRGMVGGSTI